MAYGEVICEPIIRESQGNKEIPAVIADLHVYEYA